VAVGSNALQSTVHTSGEDAYYNTAIGYRSLYNNTTGNANTCIGHRTGLTTTTGSFNVAVGNDAFELNTTGNQNTAVGYDTLNSGQTLNGNTAVGFKALDTLVTGNYNTAIGIQAGEFVSGGGNISSVSSSVFVGSGALGPLNNGDTNEIVIAGGSTGVYGAGSNTAVLGDAATTDVYFGSATAAANIHAVGGAFSGNISGVGGTFSGNVSGAAGVFSTLSSTIFSGGFTSPTPKVFAASTTATVNLAISIGDCVVIFTNSATTPNGTPTDNGSSGGNTYVAVPGLIQESTAYYGKAWICLSATKTATSVTTPDSGGCICGGTFSGVTAVGNVHVTLGSASVTNTTDTVTTLQQGSYVISGAQVYNVATALSALQGTQRAVSADGGGASLVQQIILTTAAPTIAAITQSATYSPSSSGQWQEWSIELQGSVQAVNITSTDTSLSRAAANTIQIGNTGGTPDASGTLKCATLIEGSTLTPASATTAGVTGQIAWQGTNGTTGQIFICTSGGTAGSAIWMAATLAKV
jgi:hypothetical protein